ncbi:hypothetical protein PG995_000904 [Apiospora arundinis]
MAGLREPVKSQEPGLGAAALKNASQRIPLNLSENYPISQHPVQQLPGKAQGIGRQHKPLATSTNKKARPKPRPHNDKQPSSKGGSKGSKDPAAISQSNKEKQTQRNHRRGQKRSVPSKSPPRRPDRTPSGELAHQGYVLHRELDRVERNGQMIFWQEYIFTSAFKKIRKALLVLRDRAATVPITEKEDRARAYAREAFDRFKMCMEKV